MQVKLFTTNTLHSAESEPIMLILTDQDKKNIAAMAPGATKYCVYPDWMVKTQVEAWMDEPLAVYKPVNGIRPAMFKG